MKAFNEETKPDIVSVVNISCYDFSDSLQDEKTCESSRLALSQICSTINLSTSYLHYICWRLEVKILREKACLSVSCFFAGVYKASFADYRFS